MICKMCNNTMSVSGTRYEQKKNKDGSKQFLHKPYCECTNCRYRKYTKSPNFQEVIKKVTNT